MPNPESPLPTDFVEKLGGRMDSLSCATPPAKLDANGQPRPLPRINADWLPFAPGSRFPLPEPGLQPLPSDEDWTPGAAYLPTTDTPYWRLGWGFGASQFRTNDGITAVAISPDARLIAVANRRNTLIFDCVTGRQIRALPFHEPSLSFSHDARRIWIGHRFYELATGATAGFPARIELDVLEMSGNLLCAAISPDEKLLAIGTWDELVVIDNHIGEVVLRTPCSIKSAFLVDFSPDGRFLLATTNSIAIHEISIFETGSWRIAATHVFDGWQARFASDGEHLILGTREVIRVENWRTRNVLRTIDVLYSDFAITTDRQTIFVGHDYFSHDAIVYDVESGEEKCRFLGRVPQYRALAISTDGRFGVIGTNTDELQVWDLCSGVELTPREPLIKLEAVAFSPDGTKILVRTSGANIRVFDAVSGAELHSVTHGFDVQTMAVSPDGKWAFSGGRDPAGRVWSIATGKTKRKLEFENSIWCAAFSPDGSRVIVAGNNFPTTIWNHRNGECVVAPTGSLNSIIHQITTAPNSEYFAYCGSNTPIKFFDYGGREIRRWRPIEAGLITPAFSPVSSPSGFEFAVAERSGTIHLYDWASGQTRIIASSDENCRVMKIRWSADGRRIFLWDFPNRFRTLDVVLGEWLDGDEPGAVSFEFDESAAADAVVCADVSPDGSRVVVGTARGMVFCFHRR